MNEMTITISGPKGSGKTTILELIDDAISWAMMETGNGLITSRQFDVLEGAIESFSFKISDKQIKGCRDYLENNTPTF